MKIFYCAKCKKLEVDFKFKTREEQIVRQTWYNTRNGMGKPITHMVCPKCGYVLSGYMEGFEEGLKEYVKEVIELYSTKEYEGILLGKNMVEYICNNEINKKRMIYKNKSNRLVKTVIDSMVGI